MSDDGLAAFLRARLGEDEAAAKAALDGWPPREAMSIYPPLSTSTVTRAMTAFFARHDPARVLREVGAGRAFLTLVPWDLETRELMDTAMRIRATVYSDHPDYRPDWGP